MNDLYYQHFIVGDHSVLITPTYSPRKELSYLPKECISEGESSEDPRYSTEQHKIPESLEVLV